MVLIQSHASYYVILSVAKDLLADYSLSTVIQNTLSVILNALSVILSVAKDLLADHTLSTVIQNTLSVILSTLSVILSVAKDLEVCATIHRL